MKKKRRGMDAQIAQNKKDSGKLIAKHRWLKIPEN
jgi:hypothetical protein